MIILIWQLIGKIYVREIKIFLTSKNNQKVYIKALKMYGIK